MSEVVRSYYDQEVEREWGRLDHSYRRLELVTTLHIVATSSHGRPNGLKEARVHHRQALLLKVNFWY